VRVLLDGHCIGLVGSANGGVIEQALCATFRPSRFAVRARYYVVAAGGLETARLLMAAAVAGPAPLALATPWLGRGYMGHLNGTVGTIQFTAPPEHIASGYEVSPDGVYCRRRVAIAPAAQRAHRLLNTMFRLHHPPIADPAHREPVLSAMYLVKDLVLYEYSRKLREARSWRSLAGHLRNVAAHPLKLAHFGVDWVDKRWLRSRAMPSVALFSPTGRYSIEFHAEQAPDPASRLELGSTTDRFGMPELVIDWRAGALDVESVARAYALLERELAAAGLGTLVIDRERMDAAIRGDGAVGGHHLGAVRMAEGPERGVVDRHCRLFGVHNGYVASGAVLPTSSQANPTFTIVALAIRLADHLKQRARETRLSARRAPADGTARRHAEAVAA
jgi:choline dehydrogenase-like flavoprotein